MQTKDDKAIRAQVDEAMHAMKEFVIQEERRIAELKARMPKMQSFPADRVKKLERLLNILSYSGLEKVYFSTADGMDTLLILPSQTLADIIHDKVLEEELSWAMLDRMQLGGQTMTELIHDCLAEWTPAGHECGAKFLLDPKEGLSIEEEREEEINDGLYDDDDLYDEDDDSDDDWDDDWDDEPAYLLLHAYVAQGAQGEGQRLGVEFATPDWSTHGFFDMTDAICQDHAIDNRDDTVTLKRLERTAGLNELMDDIEIEDPAFSEAQEKCWEVDEDMVLETHLVSSLPFLFAMKRRYPKVLKDLSVYDQNFRLLDGEVQGSLLKFLGRG